MAEALTAMARVPDRKPGRHREAGGRDHGMQRVRVGVTGLAAVFLLTLLAASLFALLGQDTHGPARGTDHAAAGQDAPKEPLAELGVAPGNAPKAPAGDAQAKAAPPPVPAAARPPAAAARPAAAAAHPPVRATP